MTVSILQGLKLLSRTDHKQELEQGKKILSNSRFQFLLTEDFLHMLLLSR